MEFTRIDEFLPYFESVRGRTRRLADHVPDDRLEWSSGPDRFTPGDLVRHVAAAERWMWAENVCGRPSRYPGHGTELAEGKAATLEWMDRLHAESVEIFSSLTPERLQQRCTTVGGIDMRVWKWLRLMVEHEIHHRGQLYEVLGRMGVATPSLYGLTEPEVKARSEPLHFGGALRKNF